MRFGPRQPLAAVFFVGATVAAAAPLANESGIAALDQIEAGQWQLQEVGRSGAPRQMCIADPAALIQLEHAGVHCTRIVVSDEPRSATVHYTCPGAGNGRTTIRLETRSAFHIDTQGIAGGAPFDMAFEAKRMGACPARH